MSGGGRGLALGQVPLSPGRETLVRPGSLNPSTPVVSVGTGSGCCCRRCAEHGNLAGGTKDTRTGAAPRVRGTPRQMPALRTSPGAGPRRGCGLGSRAEMEGTEPFAEPLNRKKQVVPQGRGLSGVLGSRPQGRRAVQWEVSSQPAWGVLVVLSLLRAQACAPDLLRPPPLRGPSLLSIRASGEFPPWCCPTWRVPWGRGDAQAS